jgi:hypothetical protein
MSTDLVNRARATTAGAVMLACTYAAAVLVSAGAIYWLLFRFGALLMPNPEAAAQMFSP